MKPRLMLAAMLAVVLLCGCLESAGDKADLGLKEYSHRVDGSRDITIYKSSGDTIRATVIKNSNPPGYGDRDLSSEVERLIANPDTKKWEAPLRVLQIDGHKSISSKIIQVDPNTGIRTNNVQDLYVTIIAYPERKMLLTIMSNGAGVDAGVHSQIVNKFKY